jgi:hypothetical protein
MKVLTHEGVVLTLPFTIDTELGSEFERIDGNGSAAVGIVTEISEATVRSSAQQAARLEQAFATARQITNDLQFIARSLSDVADGAEIRVETKGSKIKLVIPESARPKRDPIKAGDRVAVNAQASPKTLLNTHGTVESVTGDRATVKLDEGDRQRVIRATGKAVPASVPVPTAILDKLESE